MKKVITIVLIFAQLVSFTGNLIAADSGQDMQIMNVKKNYIAGNKGLDQGIPASGTYHIIRRVEGQRYIIGKAEIIKVTRTATALKVVQMSSGMKPAKGDTLAPAPENMTSQVQAKPSKQSKKLPDQSFYYFSAGQLAAQQNYKSNSMLATGIVSAGLLGPVGWGAGYMYIKNSPVQVPRPYINRLAGDRQHEFVAGYSDTIRRLREKRFNAGATIGIMLNVMVIAVIVANANS